MSYADNFPKPNEKPEPKVPADRPKNSEFANQSMPPAPPPIAASAAKPAEPEKKAQPQKPKFNLSLFILYALLTCLGVVIAKYAYDFFMPAPPSVAGKPSKSVLPPLVKVVSDQKSGSQDAQGKPLVAIKKRTGTAPGSFTLSGIYFEGETGYCIVNDKILEVGSTIEGATVTSIGPDAVELMLNNKLIRLTIRTK
jgi:hypothetical protein